MAIGIGLSALHAASEAIDATSNNIANAQTIGYKAGQYVFQDEFFRAADPQNPNRTGMGTAITQIRRPQTNGSIVATSNPLDLAIGGIGMFTTAQKVVDGSVTGNPSNFQYTRNGQFGVDNQNRIINQNGNYLVGYPANPDGTINTSQSSVLSLNQDPLPGAQTLQSKVELNLDNTTNPVGSTFDPTTSGTYSQSTSQTIYDSTGLAHTLSLFYVKQPSVPLQLHVGAAAGTFTYDTQQAASATTVTSNNFEYNGTNLPTLTATGFPAPGGHTVTAQIIDSNGSPVGSPEFLTPSGANASITFPTGQAAGAYSIVLEDTTTHAAPVGISTTVPGVIPKVANTSTPSSSTIETLSNASVSQVSGTTYLLTLQDGSTLTVTANSAQNPTSFTIPTSRFAVFATIDGNPVPGGVAGSASQYTQFNNANDGYPSGSSNTFAIDGVPQTALGTMAFVGGKNIDSLAKDAYGVPNFATKMNISTTVGSTNKNNVAFTIDSTNMTAYSAVGQTYTNSQDGAPLSQLSSYSFDNSGKLVAVYSNGQSKVQGQVKLAVFTNDEGLIPIGGNSYEESALSGTPTFGEAGSGLFGGLKSQALEQSNVDLTSQLVTLMSLQRQYSAASQVVKTSQAIQDDVLNKLS